MRLLPVAFAAAIVAATMSSAGHGQRADDQVDPRSSALTRQAETALTGGQADAATDLYETALALDPRNRQAYIGLARAAQGLKLPGKAIKFYFEALKLEPNDIAALAGQGEALVQRGAVERAKKNLERIRTLCANPCPQATQLAAVIAKGPPPEVLTAQRPAVGAPKP